MNYPSAGSRFVAWWSADAFTFGVYDLLEDRTRVIERYPPPRAANVLRPHIAWDLLVWLYVEGEGDDSYAELRYARHAADSVAAVGEPVRGASCA